MKTIDTCKTCVSTISPWEFRSEANKGVVDGPGNDEVVVDDHEEADHQHAVPEALGGRSHSAKHFQGSLGCVLTQGKLEEEEWKTRYQQHGQVRY